MWKEFFSFRTRCVRHGGRNQTLKSILIVSAICLAFAQRYQFSPRVVTILDEVTDADLLALPEK